MNSSFLREHPDVPNISVKGPGFNCSRRGVVEWRFAAGIADKPLVQRAAQVEHIEVGPDRDGQRLDNYLIGYLGGAPRSLIYRIVRKGEVRVNRGRVRPNYRLRAGDVVRVPPVRTREPASTVPEGLVRALPARVIHEDDDLLVLNKPAGVAVHGGTGLSGGVIEALRQARPAWQQLDLAHRLDRGTSGCLVMAKHRGALKWLNSAFRDRRCIKRYLALVAGEWPQTLQTVDVPVARERLAQGERDVVADASAVNAREAVSHFTVLQRLSGLTLMEVTIDTGRMHQIRVHAAHTGHPLAGDSRYGDPDLNRQLRQAGLKRMFLHAHYLELPDQAGDMQVFSAPLDEDLRAVLDKLEQGRS